MEVEDKKDTPGAGTSENNKNNAKCPPISEEVPAEKNSSVDTFKSEPEKVEIPAEPKPETKPEVSSEHVETIHTDIKHEEVSTHTKASDEVTIHHEESKIEVKAPESVVEPIPVVSQTEKDNKDDHEIDVIENPASKVIFTHFVKGEISKTIASEHTDEEIKNHDVHEDHKIVPTDEIKASIEDKKEPKVDEPEKKDSHEEIKEVPLESKPQEHVSEVVITEPVEDKPKKDSHEEIKEVSSETKPQEHISEVVTTEPIEDKPKKDSHEEIKEVPSDTKPQEHLSEVVTTENVEEKKEVEDHLYECEFSVQYETKFGENIIVVGSIEELGSWDPLKGLNLTWNSSHRWTGALKFSNLPFEYKYACKSDEETTWEKGVNRAVTEPPSKPLIDLWQPI
ncbi:hypothetical protein SteCoe_16371 [Stentor coeruleus]|uniref:CBM20 domain-containing protein n=1 Tax=Stentor coeruleus TaxID=5963 RepID=A0A1R2C1E1_9CILI|nr:hypothetical protein SteCoe_16371 [Stentor coeruleus]